MTLLKICSILDTTPNNLLGLAKKARDRGPRERLQARLSAASNALSTDDLQMAVIQIEALVAHRTDAS